MLGVALSAIMKVCVSVFVGIFTGKSIPFARTTLRDFGFLSSNVLLPCLALSSTAESISWEIVLRCVILLLFMLIQLAVGYGCAVLMTWVLFPPKPHHTGLNATLAKDIRLELMYEKITVPRNTTVVNSNNIVNNNTNKDANEKVEKQEKHNEAENNTNTNVANNNNNSDVIIENGITMINTSSSSNTTTINKPFIAVIVKDKVCHVDMITERELLPLLEIPSIQYDHYPAYLWMSIIACTIPNTISVPLALLQNLITSLSFLNFNYGVTYIMLFNTVCTIYLWGAAPFLLRSAQRQVQERSQLRELMMELKFLHSKMDAYIQTDNSALLINSSRSSSNKVSPLETPLSPTTQLSHSDTSESNNILNCINKNNQNIEISECGERSYAWEELNLIRIFRESEYKEIQSGVRSVLDQTTHTPNEQQVSVPRRKTRRLRPYKHYKWLTNKLMWRRIAKQALYLPFLATLVGAIIGLISPLKNLFFNGGVLEMIMDAMALVAQGAIPALLVLIGANLGGSLTPTPAVVSTSSCNSLLASNGRTSVMRGGRRGMLNKIGQHNNNNNTALASSLKTQPSESTLLATVVMENYGQNVNFTFDAADLELLASEGDLDLNAAAAAFDRRAAEEAAQQKAEMAERKRINKLKRAAKRREARLAAAAAAAKAKTQHEGDNTISKADRSDANKSTSKDFIKNKQNNEFDTEAVDYEEDYDEDEEDEDDEEMEMSVDMHASFALHPIVELTGVHDMVNKTGVSEEGHEMQTWQERAEQVESKISHGILCKTQDESSNNDKIRSKDKSNEKRVDETHKQNGVSLHKEDKLHHKSHGKTLMTNTQYVMFTSPSPAQSPTTTRADMAAHTREENEENVNNESANHVIIDYSNNIDKNEKEEKEDDSNHVINSHMLRNESTLEHPTAAPQSTSVEIILPEENEQPNTYWAAVCAAFSLSNVSKRFVWGNIFVRLVLVPAINLIILYAAVKLFPSMFIHGKEYGRTLVVTLILQLSAPTAISSLVLFQAQEFMVYT